jgi:RimJ/RimL family protein N-acetyltransferase
MRKFPDGCADQRIYLGPVLEEHLSLLFLWFNDLEVIKYLDLKDIVTPENLRDSWRTMSQRTQTDIVFSICLKDGDEIIGETGLHDINTTTQIAEAGFIIGRKDLWNMGYGKEAQILLLRYAFDVVGLQRVLAKVHYKNIASLRCLEHIGYRSEGLHGHQFCLSISKLDYMRKGGLKNT